MQAATCPNLGDSIQIQELANLLCKGEDAKSVVDITGYVISTGIINFAIIVPKQLYTAHKWMGMVMFPCDCLWAKKFEFLIAFSHATKYYPFVYFFQSIKNMKTILGSWTVLNQTVSQIWFIVCGLLLTTFPSSTPHHTLKYAWYSLRRVCVEWSV